MQYGLLPREEAEAWVLEQAQVRHARAVGGTAGNEHALYCARCLQHSTQGTWRGASPPSAAAHASPRPRSRPLPRVPHKVPLPPRPQKKGGGKSPAKPAAKRPSSRASEPKRKRAAADDRWAEWAQLVQQQQQQGSNVGGFATAVS